MFSAFTDSSLVVLFVHYSVTTYVFLYIFSDSSLAQFPVVLSS